jgi:two-component system chemotaxis sensor kinase CheA
VGHPVVATSVVFTRFILEEKVNVPEEDHKILEDFIEETMEMVRKATPFVRALIDQPDREDILPKMTESCFRLFHSIKGTGGFLHLEHLVGPAEAMEYLLDRIRSGVQSLAPLHISLVAESCQFMEQGLPLVLAEKSDERLAPVASALTAAIFQSTRGSDEDPWTQGTGISLPSEMQDTFLSEIENLLATAEQEFVLWDFIALDHHRVAELCRLLHRLQQNFTLFELKDLERLSLALESTLTRYIQGEFFQTEYPERVFLRSIDAVRETVARFIRLQDAAVTGLEHHLDALQGLIRKPIGTLLVEAGMVAPQVIEDALELQKSSRQATPRRLGEVLVDMGEVTRDQVQHVLQEQHEKRTQAMRAETKLESISPPLAHLPPAYVASNEVCIDGKKLARIVELIERLATEWQPAEGSTSQLVELLELAKSCKQTALSSFSSWLKRVVHDLAVQGNKRVHFVIEGIDTMLDQRHRALLAEPLFHLLRNGVEHGLETVEERVKAGKRKSGKLTLLALQQGNEIWVSVEDDGRGIGQEKIAALAVEHRLVQPQQAAMLTSKELIQLLFQAQSTTGEAARKASDLDTGFLAVKDSLQQMQGKIEMLSRPNKGTRITLRVPRQP